MQSLNWILEGGREYAEPASLEKLYNTRLIKFWGLPLFKYSP